ncbi:ABC transporter substrate-binding protein [Nocardiopsis ganjiahuensis]|uniref:ABC transporter substrate-binding protein n=1 Tax=Nocardiopsis ganjiahuensis TaxID=239984 RepID=UPI000347A7FC|nr:hypothetical protein [Nocardiopsis ganjiahuensis]
MADTGGKDWKRALLLGFAGALAVTLVATTVALWDRFTCGGPDSGVQEIDGQCIGITDGSYSFHPQFERIQNQIKQENDRVEELGQGETPVVRVAFLGILTFDSVSPMDAERMLRSLEGAYTAVRRANSSQSFGDKFPQIQLVLANVGSQQEQWGPVVDDLVSMSEDEKRPLVAVTGMGVSIPSTRDIAERLNAHNIPMVSSAVTADGLAHGPRGLDDAGDPEAPALPGVIRAAPSNNEYIKALGAYLDAVPSPVRALIVQDTNDDLFASTLYQAYREHLQDHIDEATQSYRGTTVGDTPISGLFQNVARNVCSTQVNTVLFAGRAPDLDVFLDALDAEICTFEEPLRILFVVTGLSILEDERTMKILEANDITLVYASGIDTRWQSTSSGEEVVPRGYSRFRDAYLRYVEGGQVSGLANGYALVNHDAAAVAVRAVRMTAEEGGTEDVPTPEEVRSRLMLLNSAYAVEAGGGTLSYSPEGGGEATGRYVPIVELPMTDPREPLPDPHVIGSE